MPQSDAEQEVHEAYRKGAHWMDERIRKLFSEWSQSLDHQNLKRLDQPLMIRCKDKTGMLDINFNKYVSNLHRCPFFSQLSLLN